MLGTSDAWSMSLSSHQPASQRIILKIVGFLEIIQVKLHNRMTLLCMQMYWSFGMQQQIKEGIGVAPRSYRISLQNRRNQLGYGVGRRGQLPPPLILLEAKPIPSKDFSLLITPAPTDFQTFHRLWSLNEKLMSTSIFRTFNIIYLRQRYHSFESQ